ncbi:transcription factor [Fusarium beomiforme]|uniref:Transcription factor n=1 Tax=Fusarium beomiforme TaxID=44412 RepID=A0A9P5APT1_9HYPO|nr:transcription factor [Fusarium beomiforme]
MSPNTELRKYACSICARRKVKCDRQHPCSNCQKGQAECTYEAPLPPKPRKRAADEDLLARLAQYEQLMKKNGVDYTQHANIWVESGLEMKSEDDTSTTATADAPTELCLWSKLSPELKYPPMVTLRHKDDPSLHPIPSLHTMLFESQTPVYEIHPEPKQIFLLWQTFVECVNPFIKIIHVPSLQKRILDASWDPANIPKPLSAIMFAIYLLSVTSMSAEDCQTSLGEGRVVLLKRYRTATIRALAEADFLTPKDLETLQAMVLFIFSNSESEIACTLTGVAIRTGQMMGLHKADADAKLSFFQKEMRIRIWWQIKGLDSRVRASLTPGIKQARSEFGDVRLPFNINDADLHPDMLEPPVEHTGPTEMVCVLMKFEVTHWLRFSPKAAKVFECLAPGFGRPPGSTKAEDDALDELEAIYMAKYLNKLDRAVPFHDLTYAMAKLAIARMRFKVHHPRGRTPAGERDVYITKEESDITFNAALSFIELVFVGFNSKFSTQMFTHLTSYYQIDAWIYVISELRRRVSGPRISLAWKLVDSLYAEHPELVDSVDNPLFTALGNLILEAWEARRKTLSEVEIVPSCVELLWSKRRVTHDAEMVGNALDSWEFNVGDGLLDWNYWSDFVRF